jgi:anthraniloyl-CoA monooxygenase
MQFSFHLLTRSGRLNYDNLRLRDPYYVEKVDRWFRDDFRGDGTSALVAAPPAFTPLNLRDLTLTNRVVLTPSPCYTSNDGLPDAAFASRLQNLAAGGAGLVLTESVAVSAEGRITPRCPGLYRDGHQEYWQQVVDDVHHTQAKIALQLNHAGRRGSTRPRQFGLDVPLREGNWPLLSASDAPYTPKNQTPKATDRADMDAVKAQFVQSAAWAAEIGFDMLLLNMAQGYLLASFLSPLTNAGSLEERLRFPLEVFAAVRDAWAQPLAVAINADDWARGGITHEDVEAAARIFTEKGCDLIYPLAGGTVPNVRPDYGPNYLARYSESIRNAAGIPTLGAGNITTINQVNSLLAAGSADLCILST